ncbi:Ger(x)C family spore germination protein [Fictibacillus terranigra]|uniref:Ger(X)C family spore germination protein n=1 Tax=Fictibacillus terranigra TaxID=3058424 RepID=A0ABT8E562_9BACL|nr:Ger(x)C family spore germination protein [Fictibacillus sp. CENA-BCM004]MDN4073033.1 Ger(x)C family spore germination protein [Fictibacillus sp. CENA-BCM004]
MNNIKKAFVIIFLSILNGCSIQPRILEDIQLVTSFGYDYAGKDKIKATINMPITPVVENAPPGNQVLTAIGHTSKNIRQILQSRSPKPLYIGRTTVVLYSKTLAEHGILSLINTLQRDPELGRDLTLAVVDGKVEPLLSFHYPWAEVTTKYMEQLLEQNELQNIPKTNIHDFLFRYYGKGADPFMPLLKKKGNEIKIKGMALFKGDRYVGYIPYRKSFIMKLLFENFKSGIYEFKLKKENHVAIENLASKVDYDVQYRGNQPHITINVNLQGKISEFQSTELIGNQLIKSVEKQADRTITREAKNLVHTFQDLNVDPLGLGHKVNNVTPHFNFSRWNKAYADVPIDINVKIKVVQSGITE